MIEKTLDNPETMSEDTNTVVVPTDASKPEASCAPPSPPREGNVGTTTGAQQTSGFSFCAPVNRPVWATRHQYTGHQLAIGARLVAFPLRLHKTAAGDYDKAAIDESGCHAEPGTNPLRLGRESNPLALG